jgi:hypothetical protein
MHVDINKKLIHKGGIIVGIKLCFLFTVSEELQWALQTGTVSSDQMHPQWPLFQGKKSATL